MLHGSFLTSQYPMHSMDSKLEYKIRYVDAYKVCGKGFLDTNFKVRLIVARVCMALL